MNSIAAVATLSGSAASARVAVGVQAIAKSVTDQRDVRQGLLLGQRQGFTRRRLGARTAKLAEEGGIRKDQEFEIVLKRDVTMPVLDY